jgi:hypothetical protein
MVLFITLTTFTHGILFFYDEYILHKRRSLSRNEINSALIDGVLFLVPVGLTLFTSFGPIMKYAYIVLGLMSCISVIKNEIFYPNLDKVERLVHGGLYVLHPLILYAFFVSWESNFFATNLTYWMLQLCYFILCFKGITYHLIYWNYVHEKSKGLER